MKTHHSYHRSFFCLTAGVVPATLLGLICFGNLTARGADVPKFQPNPDAGAGDVIVHGKFGGNIFDFEIDPNGTEGLLCEAVGNPDRTVTAAVETFDHATGSKRFNLLLLNGAKKNELAQNICASSI